MGIFSKFKKGFQKGAEALQGSFSKVLGGKKLDANDMASIEEALYSADFGVETTEEIIQNIHEAFKKDKEFKGQDALHVAREVLRRTLSGAEKSFILPPEDNLQVLCMIGVNGSGKTTTCAKLGHLLKERGDKVLLGACDTFRAAATEQLKAWADRLGLECVFGHHGADSAAVAFDTFSAASARHCNLAIIDTAGRLHVKDNLMDELFKMKRVLSKRDEGAPHHSWLVIDGSTGTNGLEQAKVFNQKFGLTGLVVTKLDGSSKGGVLVSIYRELKLPIYFLGLGESADDLQPFSIEYYLDSILPLAQTLESQ